MHIYLFCKVEVAKLGIVIVHGSILLNTTAHPKDIIPRHGLITGAKIRIFWVSRCKDTYKTNFLLVNNYK